MAAYNREDLSRVVFSDLTERCSEELLYELCTQFGPVRTVNWPTVATSTLSGVAQRATYCFVNFVCPEDAKYCFQVLRDAHVKLFDKEIRVSHASTELALRESSAPINTSSSSAATTNMLAFANTKNNMNNNYASGMSSVANGQVSQSTPRHGPQRGLHEIGAKVIVRNVDRNATEFDITSFFRQFGSFAAPPRLSRDNMGNFRGTVVLSYEDFAFSDSVIAEMHNKIFRDRIISVQYAELEDGSGKLHGSEEERQNAILIQEEARKYAAKVQAETNAMRATQQQQRASNTSWADNVNVYAHRPASPSATRQ